MGRRASEITRASDDELEVLKSEMSHEDQALLEKELHEYSSMLNSNRKSQLEIINPNPDYDYFWWPRAVYNEEIPGKLAAAAREFWKPVPESELPMMSNSSNHAFSGVRSSFIEFGNLILHKRHKRFRVPYYQKLIKEMNRVRNSISIATGFAYNTPGKVDESRLRFDDEIVAIKK